MRNLAPACLKGLGLGISRRWHFSCSRSACRAAGGIFAASSSENAPPSSSFHVALRNIELSTSVGCWSKHACVCVTVGGVGSRCFVFHKKKKKSCKCLWTLSFAAKNLWFSCILIKKKILLLITIKAAHSRSKLCFARKSPDVRAHFSYGDPSTKDEDNSWRARSAPPSPLDFHYAAAA